MNHFPRIIAIALFCLILAPLTASAYDVNATLEQVDQYVRITGADPDEAALMQTYAVFAPEKLPASLRMETASAAGWFCATPAILSLQEAAEKASPEVRREMEMLLPWKSRFGADTVADSKTAKDFNPNGVDPALYNNYQTEHFNFYWGNDSEYGLTDMQSWGVIFEEIYSIEVGEWGWDDVYLTDQYYIDVYLGNSGEGLPDIPFQGAYTTMYNNYQPLMVFHPDILSHESYIKDVSSHEFFHCMQFTVAVQPGGCYNYMSPGNNWGIEGTAVWAEDEVYDDLNHYKYQIGSYADAPHSSLVTDDFYQVYARVIWWKYVTETFNGRQTVYDLFHGTCRSDILSSIQAIFRDEETDILEQYAAFARANVFLSDSYEEGSTYPDFAVAKKISSYPDTYEPQTSRSAQLLGANYIKLSPDGENEYLTIEFDGVMKIDGRPFGDWLIQILAVKSDKSAGDYDLTTMLVDEDGQGTASIEGFGAEYETVWVIVSPMDEEPRTFRGSEYAISFDVGETPESDDDDDDSASDDDDNQSADDDDSASDSDDDDDDDDDGGSCCG